MRSLAEATQAGLSVGGTLVVWRGHFDPREHGVCPLDFWLSKSWLGLKAVALIASNSIIPLELLEKR